MKTRWILAALAACALALLAAGCNNAEQTVPVEGITLNKASLALAPSDTARLEATVWPASASGWEVAWSSSDPNVATVDGGVVTAGDTLGTATITAQVGSMTATCEVTVKELSEIFVMDGGTLTEYTGSATTVVIPDSVMGIGERAFYGRNDLTSVEMPASVTSIGFRAFSGCTSLTEVNYTGTLAEWCGISWYNDTANPLSNGKAVLYIGDEAVTDAEIPEGVTEIKDYAFCGYRSLESVTIPDGVTSIGDMAFSGCKGLGSVEIPDSVTSIGMWAFSGCTSLESVEIPASVTSIGWDAFRGCTSLESVNYGGTLAEWCGISWDNDTANPLSNENAVLYIDGEQLTEADIPGGVESIRGYAFSGYSHLRSVTIPEGVMYIWSGAFKGCTNLESVEIPKGVTEIGWYVFSGCTGLKSVTIPEGVTSIENYAFEGCYKLTNVRYNGTEEGWRNNITIASDSGLSGKTITGKDADGNEAQWTAQ